MKIVMMTNLYRPHVGGIQRSIEWFAGEFRRRGHEVLIAAPRVERHPLNEPDVVEVPAIQNFSESGFSLALPLPRELTERLDDFEPDIIHSHHPFLLGDSAMRAAAKRDLPLVFTYHTMWEHYTHYAPSDSQRMQEFVVRLAVEYCNLCDHVIVPSQSVKDILNERRVDSDISVIPTGIRRDRFASGDGTAARRRWDIPEQAFVAGHVGRLTPEKNLGFLARAVAQFLAKHEDAWFLVAGEGPETDTIDEILREAGLHDRLVLTGSLQGDALVNVYHAMDVFAFSSKSETQGLVLAEAMSAGLPVVALDAPGARDVVSDGENGRLLSDEDEAAFATVLNEYASSSEADRRTLRDGALRTAEEYSLENCASRALALYEQLFGTSPKAGRMADTAWMQAVRTLKTEWELWRGRAEAAYESFVLGGEPQ